VFGERTITMQKHKVSLFAAAAYLALVGTLVITTPRSGQSQGKGQPQGPDVRVTNTTSEPVPVSLQGTGKFTGDVNVVNSPTVNLAAGSKVGIDPASDGVTIKNTDSNPVSVTGTVRDEQNPGRQPFSYVATVGPNSQLFFTVPTDKRLVMTYVDARSYGSPDIITIYSKVNSQPTLVRVPFSVSTSPDRHYANQQILGFADPGTMVGVYYFAFGSDLGAEVNIHGYYVDVP
jgi:hypothetical protein